MLNSKSPRAASTARDCGLNTNTQDNKPVIVLSQYYQCEKCSNDFLSDDRLTIINFGAVCTDCGYKEYK